VATLTRTHTLLNAWASTTPLDPAHNRRGRSPAVGDPCAVPSCERELRAGEECYAVIESGGPDAPEPTPRGHAGQQWVCWRHVYPDTGPV
jgi:hypothetical protein